MEVAVLAIGPATQPPDKVKDKAVEEIRDENNGEDFGKPVSNDEDKVVVPVTFNDIDQTVSSFLRGHIRKVHHYYVSLSGSLDEDASDSCKMQFRLRLKRKGCLRGGNWGTTMRMLRIAMIAIVLLPVCSVRLSDGQMFPPQQPTMPGAGRQGTSKSHMPGDDSDPLDPHREEQQAKLRNDDRQKKLVADTDKLLVLATDLKAQVDKSTKDTLSVDVIRKAEEIEKLAHSVKERMKG